MNQILPQESRITLDFERINADDLSTRNLRIYRIALFLQGQGHSLTHHCATKSESAKASFFKSLQVVYSFSDSYGSCLYS